MIGLFRIHSIAECIASKLLTSDTDIETQILHFDRHTQGGRERGRERGRETEREWERERERSVVGT